MLLRDDLGRAGKLGQEKAGIHAEEQRQNDDHHQPYTAEAAARHPHSATAETAAHAATHAAAAAVLDVLAPPPHSPAHLGHLPAHQRAHEHTVATVAEVRTGVQPISVSA
jgi:hypothetical protein